MTLLKFQKVNLDMIELTLGRVRTMKLSKNSVSTVLFSIQEGKRNGNDLKAPMNPDAPDERRSGLCILRDGREANWNPGADPLSAGHKAGGL